MLQILLFLTAQLFALTLSSTISPMSHAPELSTKTTTTTSVTSTTTTQTATSPAETQVATQTSTPKAITPTTPEPSTPEAESLQNNVFVFLNETDNYPEDMLLRNYLALIISMNKSPKEHVLAPIQAVKKLCLFLKEELVNNPAKNDIPPIIKNFSSFYLVNNSRYCLILPRTFRNRETYEQSNLLDMSSCTPLCTEELLSEDDSKTLLEKLLIRIQNIEHQLSSQEHQISSQEKDRLKKESAVLQELFKKQIKAHDLFASDPQVDGSIYAGELYKLATQPWHFYFTGHGLSGGSIAGFDFETGEIWKTLKVLNHLSTGYLIISSCHAGGINKEILIGRYALSTDDPSVYKKLEALINNLIFSYKIILCSPIDALSKTSYLAEITMIEEIIKINQDRGMPEEKRLLEILGESSLLLGKNVQVNQLPLINRPYQSTFKPFLPSSKKEYSNAVIDNAYTITSTTQRKHYAEKTTFSVNEKSVIETDRSIIYRKLKIQPQVSSSATREQIKNLFKNGDNFGHEEKLPCLFPVLSDQKRRESTSPEINSYEWYPHYPFFLSLQTGNAYHYIHTITAKGSGLCIPGEQGVFLCLRDLFFNANMRSSTKLYFIKSITGTNDIPQDIIAENIFGENFPPEGSPLTLSNVAIANYYNIENKVHYLFCAFSYQESYYFFTLKIEDKNSPKDWGCLQKLDSREQFEKILCSMENLTCSKIYNRLASYPLNHPQDQLINEYLYRKKSIFLDFQNSYPLFKDDHLPEDDRAWEQLPELVKKHVEKQKGIGSIAEHQLKNQATFAPVLKKIEEYQKRPILERPILEDHENGHPEDSHI